MNIDLKLGLMARFFCMRMRFGFDRDFELKTSVFLIRMSLGFDEDLKFRTNGEICFSRENEI
jgi:hypothetical protein